MFRITLHTQSPKIAYKIWALLRNSELLLDADADDADTPRDKIGKYIPYLTAACGSGEGGIFQRYWNGMPPEKEASLEDFLVEAEASARQAIFERATARRRPGRPAKGTDGVVNWLEIDWTKSNAEIARETGVRYHTVYGQRRRYEK